MKTPILYIVIPCYNEEKVLPMTAPLFAEKIRTLAEKGKIHSNSKVLFVNDGSKDKTWEIIKIIHGGSLLCGNQPKQKQGASKRCACRADGSKGLRRYYHFH